MMLSSTSRGVFILVLALIAGCSEDQAASVAPSVDAVRITNRGYVNDTLGFGIGYGTDWTVRDRSGEEFSEREHLLTITRGTPPDLTIAMFSESPDGAADAMEFLGRLVPLMEGVWDDLALESVELGGRTAARLLSTHPENRTRRGTYCIFLRGRAVYLSVLESRAGTFADAVAVIETIDVHD